MTANQSLDPDILFHFTTKKGLYGILKATFSISYARDKIIGVGTPTEFAVPMVSFCDLKLSELHEAAEVIQRVVDPDANIIFGMVTDLKMENEIKLTIIATGFPASEHLQERDDHLSSMLEEALASETGELDLPPFLRRYSRSRKTEDSPQNVR